MKEKLDEILRTLDEAQRQVAEARMNAKEGDGACVLEDVELSLGWIRKKIDGLRGNDKLGRQSGEPS
jgi:hypothetical protein